MQHTFIKTPSGYINTNTITKVEIEAMGFDSDCDYAIIIHTADTSFCYASESKREDAEATAKGFLESLGFRIMTCLE